jgi:hypothetical protein
MGFESDAVALHARQLNDGDQVVFCQIFFKYSTISVFTLSREFALPRII